MQAATSRAAPVSDPALLQPLPQRLVASIASPGGDAATIVERALACVARPALSTNFRPGAAALVHLANAIWPGIPVIWVDTGYNTPATYRYVDRLVAELQLNVQVFTPRLSSARWAALNGAPPQPGTPAFERFVEAVKLEPFRRALTELAPELWLTGIRREQTEYRRELGVVSAGPLGIPRVAPLLDWRQADVDAYLARHGLVDNDDYIDPTKPGPNLECGLQTLR